MAKKIDEQQSRIEYIRIANYYYKSGLTQEEIAKKMHMSRQRVNRILGKCMENGIVQIVIPELDDTDLALETELEKKYDAKGIRIARSLGGDFLYDDLGYVASQYLMSVVKEDDIIGFSRGRSVSGLVEKMPRNYLEKILIVQLMGSWNDANTKMSSDDIVHRFSEKIGGRSMMMHAPVVVKSSDLKKSIMAEPFFVETYETIKQCTIAIVGIGNAKYEKLIPTMGKEDYELMKEKAVGEICTHFFDQKGNPVVGPLNERVIAIQYDDYLNIPLKIGIAGGIEKIDAIKGALKGKLIDVLITDHTVAEEL